MKVLIAVDGSADSFATVEFVGRLVSSRDQIAFYYSLPAATLDKRGLQPQSGPELADRVLSEAAARLPAAFQTQTERIVGDQPPQQGILLAASQWQADLIALGARGLGPIPSLLLGSVSRSIVQTAEVPTLVVRPHATPTEAAGLRLLLAFDHSLASDRAAKLLSDLTLPSQTIGKIVHVLESAFAGELPDWLAEQIKSSADDPLVKAFDQERQAERQQISAELQTLIKCLPPAFQGQTPIVVEGHPAEQILRTIQTEQIDLVILGGRKLGRFARLLLGSTSDTILTATNCSVLMIPHPNHA